MISLFRVRKSGSRLNRLLIRLNQWSRTFEGTSSLSGPTEDTPPKLCIKLNKSIPTRRQKSSFAPNLAPSFAVASAA